MHTCEELSPCDWERLLFGWICNRGRSARRRRGDWDRAICCLVKALRNLQKDGVDTRLKMVACRHMRMHRNITRTFPLDVMVLAGSQQVSETPHVRKEPPERGCC